MDALEYQQLSKPGIDCQGAREVDREAKFLCQSITDSSFTSRMEHSIDPSGSSRYSTYAESRWR